MRLLEVRLARDCGVESDEGCEVAKWCLAFFAMLFGVFIAESV